MAGNSDTILDMEALEELREDLEDAFDGFVQNFFGNARKALTDMDAALETGQAEQAGQLAHSLKGTAGYLGAVRLSARLEALQGMAKAGNHEPMAGVVAQVHKELEVLESALSRILGQS